MSAVQSAWINRKHSASAMAPRGSGATPFHQCWWSTPEVVYGEMQFLKDSGVDASRYGFFWEIVPVSNCAEEERVHIRCISSLFGPQKPVKTWFFRPFFKPWGTAVFYVRLTAN